MFVIRTQRQNRGGVRPIGMRAAGAVFLLWGLGACREEPPPAPELLPIPEPDAVVVPGEAAAGAAALWSADAAEAASRAVQPALREAAAFAKQGAWREAERRLGETAAQWGTLEFAAALRTPPGSDRGPDFRGALVALRNADTGHVEAAAAARDAVERLEARVTLAVQDWERTGLGNFRNAAFLPDPQVAARLLSGCARLAESLADFRVSDEAAAEGRIALLRHLLPAGGSAVPLPGLPLTATRPGEPEAVQAVWDRARRLAEAGRWDEAAASFRRLGEILAEAAQRARPPGRPTPP